MRVQIVAVGRKMPRWVDEAYAEYAKRLPSQYAVTLTCIATANRKSGVTVSMCQQQELQRIQQKIKSGHHVVALDEHGKQWSTSEWAAQYRDWLQRHPRVSFILGGPDGLAPELLQSANQTISLGRLTMPHGLARVVLIEQLYRAWTVVEGHPYHRA